MTGRGDTCEGRVDLPRNIAASLHRVFQVMRCYKSKEGEVIQTLSSLHHDQPPARGSEETQERLYDQLN